MMCLIFCDMTSFKVRSRAESFSKKSSFTTVFSKMTEYSVASSENCMYFGLLENSALNNVLRNGNLVSFASNHFVDDLNFLHFSLLQNSILKNVDLRDSSAVFVVSNHFVDDHREDRYYYYDYYWNIYLGSIKYK